MNKNEKIYADLLDQQNIKWKYHPKKFIVGDSTYEPDFYLPTKNLYVEIIGTSAAYTQNKVKINRFIKEYPKVKFTILSPYGQQYIVNNKVVVPEYRITFNVDDDLKKKLQLKCIKKEVTLTDICILLLTDWLNEGR